MGFVKKTWKNRVTEFPSRRKLIPTGPTNQYTVERDEGVITQEGDKFDETTMNDLETRILSGAFATYTHSKLGTVHTLQGDGSNGKMLVTAIYNDGDTFNINNNPVSKVTGMDILNSDTLNTWVTFIFDGTQLNFKSGGGVNETLPPQIRSFAVTSGNGENTLSWRLPADTTAYEGLTIVRKVGSAPTKVSDGTKISLFKTATSYTDTGLTNDVTYYYRAFPYNSKKQYQTDLTGAVAWGTPKAIDPVFGNNTWEVIDSVSKGDNIPSTWQTGDEKDISLTTGETLTMQIYGFKHDNLSDGGKVGITLGMKYLTDVGRCKINDNYSTVCNYSTSDMFDFLANDLYNRFPSDLKPYIKEVSKLSIIANNNTNLHFLNAKLFLFSESELFGSATIGNKLEGAMYPIFTDNSSRIRNISTTVGASQWSLRTPFTYYSSGEEGNFAKVDRDGTVGRISASYSGSRPNIGFCI